MLRDRIAGSKDVSPAEKYLIWFCVSFTVAACFICMLGGWSYPLDEQQDAGLHFRIIQSLVESGSYSSYVGIYYYGLIVITLKVFGAFGVVSDSNLIQASVTFVNASCFMGSLAGIYFLGRGIFTKRSTACLLVATCSTIPVLQGQFRFVRSENFLLLAAIWAIVAFLAYMREPKKRGLLIASGLLLTLAITQKISGLVVAASVVLLYFAYLKSRIDFKVLVALVLVTAVPTFAYWIAHYNYTGTWFFQNDVRHMGDLYNHTPEADIFVRANPINAWQNPRRNEHRDSMANIFLLDLYGDYWEYRYNLPKFASQHVGKDYEAYLAYIKWRARAGLLLGGLFVGLSVYSLIYFSVKKELKENGPLKQSLGWYSGIFLAHLYLVAAAYTKSYSPEDFNLVKWDYICWILPFWLIPACLIIDGNAPAKVQRIAVWSFVLLIVGGLMQSIY